MDILEEMIRFPAEPEFVPGFLARSRGAGPYPAVIVIQEWWGLVDHIKDVARRFAAQGFVALAPDLYHGRAAAEPDEARKLAMELDRQHAVVEILAAMEYLQGLECVHPKKIGVVGWCMGGGLAIATAAQTFQVGAVVAFYGMPRDDASLSAIRAPLLGLYAEHDHGIGAEAVELLEKTLAEQSVPHSIITYPGTQHAFFNDSRPHIYDPQAAADAWERTLAWFRRWLVETQE